MSQSEAQIAELQRGPPAPVRVRFLDLSVRDPREREAILAAVSQVLDHGRVVLGPEVQEFERRIAALCSRRFCIGVGSGTDALIVALKALGIGLGDEVITTPLSWVATAGSILINGATPVFCDIDETLNMTPRTLEALITPRTKAILAVHFTGHLARMEEITAIARRRGLLVIEDAAQAIGATCAGKPCGSFGDVACLSFNAMKVLGAMGDAGAVVTDIPEIAEKIAILRTTGVIQRDTCVAVSHNCRLDTLQAAILLKRLDLYPAIIRRRRAVAARYDAELAQFVGTPLRVFGYEDAHYTYTIRTPQREDLRVHLAAQGIETQIQHRILLSNQPAFRDRSRGNSPNADRIVRQILCIPAHEKLTTDEQTMVIGAIKQFFEARA